MWFRVSRGALEINPLSCNGLPAIHHSGKLLLFSLHQTTYLKSDMEINFQVNLSQKKLNIALAMLPENVIYFLQLCTKGTYLTLTC